MSDLPLMVKEWRARNRGMTLEEYEAYCHPETKCPHCGKTFKGTNRRQMYCTRACAVAAYHRRSRIWPDGKPKAARANPKGKFCPTCHEHFTVKYPGQVYCCQWCEERSKSKERAKIKECQWCGKPFEDDIHSPHAGAPRKFCSHKCYLESARAKKAKPPKEKRANARDVAKLTHSQVAFVMHYIYQPIEYRRQNYSRLTPAMALLAKTEYDKMQKGAHL